MKKEYLILLCSIVVSLGLAALVLQVIEPRLFRKTVDTQVVQLSKAVPPYYNNIFSTKSIGSSEFLLNDPVTGVRAKPFLPEIHGVGPHDLLGFRNRSVPNTSDVVVIGDSQTYGNNVLLRNNWPSVLERELGNPALKVYSMATGSWSAPQYLDMFRKALTLQPRLVIVALYSGNDLLESFRTVYSIEFWRTFRINGNLSIDDMPKVKFPPDPEEFWKVTFSDRSKTVLTPSYRLQSMNSQTAAVQTGLEIIIKILQEIAALAEQSQIPVLVTVVPTKELVFSRRIQIEGIDAPAVYRQLIDEEQKAHRAIEQSVSALPALKYVHVSKALIDEAQKNTNLYPTDHNGHPAADGYAAIGRALAPTFSRYIQPLADGVYRVDVSDDTRWYYLLRDGALYQFESEVLLSQNGWSHSDVRTIAHREVNRFPLRAMIRDSDKSRFGPR